MEIKRLTSTCIGCVVKSNLNKYPENISEEKKIEYMQRMLKIVSEAKETDSSPLIVYKLDKLRTEMFGATIDYTEIKRYFNDYIMKKEQGILAEIEKAEDALLCGIQYALTGNYIDFGTVEKVSEDSLEQLLRNAKEIQLDEAEYKSLKNDLASAKSLVFLHDNCGEIVFDHFLIKTIKKLYPDIEIISFVRGYPVLNDATMEDAKQIGLTETVRVIGNGSDIAGTCLDKISEEALELLKKADVVIAKGQANFETMNGCGFNIYYLFMCKCMLFADRFHKNLFEGMLLNDKNI